MQKHNWIIDATLLIIIIVMGVFVYLELDRLLIFTRDDLEPPSPTKAAVKNPTEVAGQISAPSLEVSAEDLAPDFELVDLEGKTIALSDFRGTSVMINFWATWCPPCREEMPLIQEFSDRHKNELVVLAINAGESRDDVHLFVQQTGLELVFLIDPDNTAATLYRVRGFPTSFFIDGDGVLQATHVGELNETLMVSYLAKVGVNE